MGDAVKQWDRTKPFRRINNEDIRARQNPAQADGDGAACGCQLPSDYPGLKDAFDEAFKDFKPGKLQSLIEELQKRAHQISTGLQLVSFLINPASVAAIQKITDIIQQVLDKTDEEIKKLLSRIGLNLAQRALRVMPQWVPVLKGAASDSVTADQIIEVEGLAQRSFINPIDVPFRQWHAWFNWNLNILPEEGYNVRSPADEPPNRDNALGNAEVPLVHNPHTIAVQWDTGAMWIKSIRDSLDQGFGASDMEQNDGPMMRMDWAWPMTNSYVWATGRWVYDCSRTTTDPWDTTRMCTMINPCKAIASARWQAFQFPENEQYSAVPAIQFLFFACKRGGYIDFPTITDQDYEFIIDLPNNNLKPPVPFPIGHTPDFPHNTIVMRPRLLLNLNQKPFGMAGSHDIEPIVEIIYPDDPNKTPEQVKVKVPLTTLPDDAEACGFILTMGWYDPFAEQAKKVKKCNVSFTNFSGIEKVRNSLVTVIRDELADDEKQLLDDIADKIGKINVAHILGGDVLIQDIPLIGKKLEQAGAAIVKELLDLFGEITEEDWLLRMGVNGRWQSRYFDKLKQSNIKKLTIASPPQYELLLSDDDLLALAVNGADFAPVGSIMHDAASDRMFKFDGNTPTWPQIVTPDGDPDQAREIRQKMAVAYALDLLGRGKLGFGLGRDNQPLGVLDPIQTTEIAGNDSAAQELARSINPIQIGKAGVPVTDPAREKQMFFARAIPDQKILMENDNIDDYSIFYTLSIQKQDDV